jgi:uncharacterized protein YggE
MEKARIWFWIGLDVLIGLLAINLLFFVMPTLSALKGSFASARTITVSAQGMTTATPDMAEVSFSVLTQGQNPQVLSQNNNDKMTAVLQFVASQGVASSDIATTNYSLQPNYQWDRNTQRNFITGYTLTQTVEVKVRNLDSVAGILGGLAPLGINQISGVNYTFQDQNKYIATARANALDKAKAQADAMARQAGASLGSVVNVSESSYIPFYSKSYATGAGVSADMAMPTPPPLQPGTQDVTDTVTVVYALR